METRGILSEKNNRERGPQILIVKCLTFKCDWTGKNDLVFRESLLHDKKKGEHGRKGIKQKNTNKQQQSVLQSETRVKGCFLNDWEEFLKDFLKIMVTEISNDRMVGS